MYDVACKACVLKHSILVLQEGTPGLHGLLGGLPWRGQPLLHKPRSFIALMLAGRIYTDDLLKELIPGGKKIAYYVKDLLFLFPGMVY